MQWAWLSLLPAFFFAAEAAAQTTPVVTLSRIVTSINEGASGPQGALRITATPGFSSATTVSYGVASFSAATRNEDFTISGTVSMTGTSGTIFITMIDDDIDENSEALVLTLTAGSGYNLGSSSSITAVVNIIDNDTAGVTITESSGSTAVLEASGTDTYTVELDSEPTSNVTITPTSGAATAATVSGALTFTPSNWDDAQTVTVTAVPDSVNQMGSNRSSTITHALTSSDSKYSMISNIDSVTVTVVDDDGPPIVEFANATFNVNEGVGGSVTLTASEAFTSATTISYTASAGTAISIWDDPLTGDFGPFGLSISMTGSSAQLELVITNDIIDEDNETFTLALSSGTGYTVGRQSTITITIVDDDIAGVTISKSSISVTEAPGAGRTDTYTVKLNTQPTGNVVITPFAGSSAPVTITPPLLTFTASNWSTAQTVTVTAVDDNIPQDGDRSASIGHGVASSADAKYHGFKAPRVAVTVVDDEGPAPLVRFSSNRPYRTGEAQVLYHDARPAADRTDPMNIRPTGWLLVSAFPKFDGNVSFTVSGTAIRGTDYYMPLTVKVNELFPFRIIDDDIDEEDETIVLTLTPDSRYAVGRRWNTFTVIISDDDEDPGIILTESGGSTVVTEPRTTDSYTLKLKTKPTAPVKIGLSSSDENAARTLPVWLTTLTIFPSEWHTAHTVSVTAVDDSVVNSGYRRSASISHIVTSDDADYHNTQIPSVTVTVEDNDGPPLMQFGPDLTVPKEQVGSASVFLFANRFLTSPINVSYTVSGTATPGDDFTALNGTFSFTSIFRIYVIIITNDLITEDDETIVLTLTAGNGYRVGKRNTITITITDDDTPGVTIGKSSVSVAEAGGTATYTVVPDTQPSHDVTINVAPGDPSVATVSPTSLTFTPANWNSWPRKTITVTGVNDNVNQNGNNRSTTITHTVSSDDTKYASVGIPSVTVTAVDDDGPPAVQFASATATANEGESTIVSLTASKAFTSATTISYSVGGTATAGTDFTAPSGTVSMTTNETAITIPITDDDIDEDNETIVLTLSSGSGYTVGTQSTITITIADNDTAGVTTSKSSVSVGEAGGTATYTVVLTSQPTHSVSIAVASTSAATVSPTSLTFIPSTWNTAQTVTVTGVNDNVDQSSNRIATITHALTSGDSKYSSISNIASVTATVVDDDTTSGSDDDNNGSMGLTFSPSALPVTEGGSGVYTVRLSTEPTGPVTVTIASDNGDVTLIPASLTFNASGSNLWSAAQPVTVSAGQDDDANHDSATLSHTASGGGYGSVTGTVNVSVTDTDSTTPPPPSAPPVVSITGGASISEGDVARFTLNATPPPGEGDPISVSVTISDSGNVVAPGQRGSRSVTIAASGTASLIVGTQDDNIYEEDGRITATVTAGSGYRPHGSSGSAVVVVKDDDPGLELSQSSLRVPEGRSTSYTMALATEPTGEVTVMVSISGGEGTGLTITPPRLVFTPSNWNQQQRVTVTAVENAAATPRTITLSHRASGGGYDGVPLSNVVVRVVSANPAAAVRGWQLRFGRTVSQQVVDALRQRWSTNPTEQGHLTVAGQTISSAPASAEDEGDLSKALGFDSLTLQQVVEDSSFTIAPQTEAEPETEAETEPEAEEEAEAEGGAPRLAVWGQGALSSFKGEGNGLSSLHGDVTTLLLGADWSTTRWQAGAALSHSWGNGSYAADAGTDGDMSSSLTGLFPYGRYGLTPRLAIWAVAGYGWGQLSLQPDGGDEDYKPNTTMGMAALGMDGLLLDGGKEGISLTSTAELLTLKTTSAEVEGLDASEGSVSRLRLGLEASRAFPLSNGASLLPTMAVGFRQDDGDAETGFGMDLGAGMVWNDPGRGIRGEVRGRTLLTHREKSFQEQGMAISFSWDPTPSNRGPSLSLSHTMGATASGGMDALLESSTMEDASPSSGGQQEFAAELAYGFPAHRDRLTLTPALALALSSTSRNYSLLWSLAPYAEQMQTPPWEVALEAERQEHSSSTPTDHSLKLTFSSLF